MRSTNPRRHQKVFQQESDSKYLVLNLPIINFHVKHISQLGVFYSHIFQEGGEQVRCIMSVDPPAVFIQMGLEGRHRFPSPPPLSEVLVVLYGYLPL